MINGSNRLNYLGFIDRENRRKLIHIHLIVMFNMMIHLTYKKHKKFCHLEEQNRMSSRRTESHINVNKKYKYRLSVWCRYNVLTI